MKVVSIPTFIAPQLKTAKILDQHRLSIGDWIKKSEYTQYEVLSHRNNSVLSFATKWMQEETTMISEVNKSKRDNYLFFDMW